MTSIRLSRLALAAVAAASLSLSACVGTATSVQTGTSVSTPNTTNQGSFQTQLNAARAAQGLGGLRADSGLMRAAQAHSNDMARRGVMSHTSADGRSASDRIRAALGCRVATAENIGAGLPSASAAFQAWISSPAHARNMLNSKYTRYGVAGSNGYWTMTLAGPCK